jgi:DNA polymerase
VSERLNIDFESRSTVDLTVTGVYPYAVHPDTGIWCLAYCFDEGEVGLWLPGQPIPPEIVDHVFAGREVRAWNAAFERVMWREIMVPRHGAPAIRDEQFVCSMAEAAAMALPRSLGAAAKAIGAAEQKDGAGHDLMMRLARPRSFRPDGTPVWWDEPERLAKLYEYCRQDVATERAIVKCLRRLTPTERRVYLLDQRMNDRGMAIDRPLVVAAQKIASEGAARANVLLAELTMGSVPAVTNHARMLRWVQAQGVETSSVDKKHVKELLEGDLPENVRKALVLRAETGLTSVAKLQAMLNAAGADDRVRGMLLYHGATTGRWAGRLVQPQNFTRGDVDDVEAFIPQVLAGDYAGIDLVEPPVKVISSLMRAMMVAGPGEVLVAADYSAIEARVLNWLAGQEDVLQMFRDGKDIYRHNAARLFQIPLDEVLKFPHRQTGKFQELGCGFGMGAKKAVEAANTAQYGYLQLSLDRAREIVNDYRDSHPQVKQCWYDTEAACKEAVANPGKRVVFGALGNLTAVKAGAYLYIVLPSGRPLCYPSPRLKMAETAWSRQAREDAAAMRAFITENGLDIPLPEIPPVEERLSLEFSSVDSKTNQWGREHTYGGKLVENIVQAVSRDLMAEAMLRAEERGFPVVCTIHDEVVAEIEEPHASCEANLVEDFEQILTELPTWATGCPVAAEGWLGTRYRK